MPPPRMTPVVLVEWANAANAALHVMSCSRVQRSDVLLVPTSFLLLVAKCTSSDAPCYYHRNGQKRQVRHSTSLSRMRQKPIMYQNVTYPQNEEDSKAALEQMR